MRRDRGYLIFHILDTAGELVVLLEQVAEMGIGHFQVMNPILELRKLVDEVVMFYRHSYPLIKVVSTG